MGTTDTGWYFDSFVLETRKDLRAEHLKRWMNLTALSCSFRSCRFLDSPDTTKVSKKIKIYSLCDMFLKCQVFL
jgi:hypothetical protein